MNEKILNAFKDLGFEMEDMGEIGYSFEYEGLNYLLMNNGDEELLSIAIPAVLDKSDVNELTFYQVMDKLNATLKYVKVNEMGKSIWLFYEREMLGEEDFVKLLPKMILHLEHGVRILRDNYEDDDSDVEDADLLNDNNETEE